MGMLEEKLKKIITDACEEQYQMGYQAGYKARELEENKDEQRRLGQVYTFGYNLGAEDAYAKCGVIEIEDIEDVRCGTCKNFDVALNFCDLQKEGVEGEDYSCGMWEATE